MTTTAAVETAEASSPSLRALIYQPATASSSSSTPTTTGISTLSVLDQLLLPQDIVYVPITNIETTWNVIRTMQVRGAPLIALTAVLGLAVHVQTFAITELEQQQATTTTATTTVVDTIRTYIQSKLDYLATSRPTAVNLFHALHDMQDTVDKVLTTDKDAATTTLVELCQRVVQAIVERAEQMLEQDIQDCHALAEYGAQEILATAAASKNNNDSNSSGGVTIVTICNTGSLATAGVGTALGVIRAIHTSHHQLQQVVALETRPYNQGSRLTALECLHHELPSPLLICDSMISAFMTTRGTVTACVVGADRVAANGDTANKIGTYQLAIVAAAHNVPFYVAAPTTTLDIGTASGNDITIEERPPDELRLSSQAPHNISVWNPAFDVTPAKYIRGIITEKGVIHPNANGIFDIKAFLSKHETTTSTTSSTTGDIAAAASTQLLIPADYNEQSVESLPQYLVANVPSALQILNVSSAEEMDCVEMGDGNLNLVFIVSSKNDDTKPKLIVKQALPYVRCVGESWPMTLERAYFEYTALVAQKEACPANVPNVYYYSKPNALMVMEYLAPPIHILRKGLIQGIYYPTMAADMGTFCAQTLFKGSGFHLSTTELRKKVEFWSRNTEMCALTEQVIFTEPYIVAANNRWTTPQLDNEKAAIEQDTELKLAAMQYKIKFVTQTDALIHADLHSGSVMCAPDPPHQTFAIDPEFAFYGPAAFDTGAFIANLFLAYVSQQGHRPGDPYADWILDQIRTFWQTFTDQFIDLWNDPTMHTGFVYSTVLFGTEMDGDAIRAQQKVHMQCLLSDTLGFAGMKMLRRIVGIAHVEDLESISDVDVRAQCERRGLAIAKSFIKSAASFATIDDAIQMARETK